MGKKETRSESIRKQVDFHAYHVKAIGYNLTNIGNLMLGECAPK